MTKKEILNNAIKSLDTAIFNNTNVVIESGYLYINEEGIDEIKKDFKTSFEELLNRKEIK